MSDNAALLDGLRQVLTTRLVIGDPVERRDVTVVPVVRVSGGGGGGPQEGGDEPSTRPAGMGCGLRAAPVGAYVLRDDSVQWRPALDVTRIVVGAESVATVAALVVWAFGKRHHRQGWTGVCANDRPRRGTRSGTLRGRRR